MALSSKSQFAPYATHAWASCALKSTTRWRTRARRSTSACAVEVGLASMDWQMPKRPHVLRADELSLPMNQSRWMSGMEISATLALGSPDLRLLRAASIWERNVATEVIDASLLVQASLAP